MDLTDEEHEICFGPLNAGLFKTGQEGICVIEKLNWIRLRASSMKPVFSGLMSHAGVCCEHAP